MQRIINLQTSCNQDCVYCQRNSFYDSKLSPSTAQVKKMIEASDRDSIIYFTGGGEPTMREDIFELITFAKDQGFASILLETNAVKLSELKYVKKLAAAGMTQCVVSLHSHQEEVSDIITGAPGTYRKTIEGMRNLVKEKIPIKTLLLTVSSLNYDSLVGYLDFIRASFPDIASIDMGFIRPIHNDVRSRKYTPRLSDVELELYNSVEHAHKVGIKISMSISCGIPLCYLHGREEMSQVVKILETGGKDQLLRIHPSEKAKVKCCSICSLNSVCTGIQKSYLEIYGDSEFYPLFIDPRDTK